MEDITAFISHFPFDMFSSLSSLSLNTQPTLINEPRIKWISISDVLPFFQFQTCLEF